MKNAAKIAGLVTYLNDMGQRVSVPLGQCFIVEPENAVGDGILIWPQGGREKVPALSLREFVHYTNGGELLVME